MFPMASEDALDLIKKLLVFNPAHRFTAADALAHRYVKDFHD
jgi:mitogen-activated protein kinase 15